MYSGVTFEAEVKRSETGLDFACDEFEIPPES